MAVEQQLLPGTFAFDAGDEIPILVHVDGIKTVGSADFFQYFGRPVFMAGITFLLDQFLT